MGAKLYADATNKVLVMTQAPDVDGFVNLNVQEEVWSDLIIDWEADVDLRRHTFPVIAIGGQTISSGKLGTTYVLADPWHIHPYEADHVFNIDGNLFTELALTQLVAPTVGAYTVTVNRNLSTLVEVVETPSPSLTPAESEQLDDMWTRLFGGKLYVDPVTAKEVIRDTLDAIYSEADVWSDDGSTPYDGTVGVARRDEHVKP